ncbi:unnamed protein product, partial [Rotaria magnacalcarata]
MAKTNFPDLSNIREHYETLHNLQHEQLIAVRSELIRKLQKHLKISQEKLSDKTKSLLEKDDTLRHYQSHITQLNDKINQLTDE